MTTPDKKPPARTEQADEALIAEMERDDVVRTEWIDGRLVEVPPPPPR